ncbi:MAG: GrpB family protein [FCB group bacterium]|jgi:GrpB-like predicted nucleotidyltransferase (UPF0157 family)|nr:GrpB family protein [FCB group bacterium]
MEIGLHNGLVELAPYAPEWADAFEAERRQIQEALGDAALDIQHIGSTAVEGMPAKPIIDIAVAIRSYKVGIPLVERIVALGYEYRGERGRPGRHFFAKNDRKMTTHHIIFLEIDGEDWKNIVRFRDALRSDPSLARRYAELKQRLADRHMLDREAYRLAKGGFIIEALRRTTNAEQDQEGR